MKSSNRWSVIVTTGVTLVVTALSVSAEDLTPNVTQPAQKTPPEVSAGEEKAVPSAGVEEALKLPPAIPLDKLSAPKTEAPEVAAKKSQPVKVKAADEAAPVKKEEAVKQPERTALPEVKPAPTPAAKPAPKPVADEEPAKKEPEVSRIPTGKAIPIVSTPLRAADKKTVEAAEKKREEEGVYFNVSGEDIREIIKQISRVTGKNFILDEKVRGEVTIISEQKMTKEELYEAFISALDVAGYTTVVGPVGLIKVVKQREALMRPIPIYTDKTPYTDKFITRLVTLKNISAVDMANAIKGLISKAGNLFAYPVTNTLIITDGGTNIDRIVKLVKELDTEGPQEVLEIIPIEYADVKDIADKITKLFGEAAPTAKRRPARRRGKQEAVSPQALPGINKIIADERTNSLIVLASKITIAKVRQIIRKLDQPLLGPEEGDIHVLYLKNAKATELAEVLTGVTQAAKKAKAEEKKVARRGAKSPAVPKQAFQGLFGSITSIRADESTNALIIQSNAKDFRRLIDSIISKLDIPRRQVYIETAFMEIAVRDGLELGTGILAGKTFSVGGDEIALFGNTFPFIPDPTTTASASGATTSSPISILPPFATSPIDFPRFFASFIAQSENQEVNVLSTPNILTLDNTEARIEVGDTVPFATGSALTTGGVSTQNIQREDIALELLVTPQITEGDNVRMNIKFKIEDFSQVPNPLEATAGPATSKREIDSEVVVPNQQTVVLGGLMEDRHSSRKTKIPLLGDIPILGHLFKGTSVAKRKTNLLTFLTPNIIREPQDFLKVLQKKIKDRNRFIDEHFGKRSRKRIRKAIANHNEKLLELQAATSSATEPDMRPTAPVVIPPPEPLPRAEAVTTPSEPKEVAVAPEVKEAQLAEEAPVSTAEEKAPLAETTPPPPPPPPPPPDLTPPKPSDTEGEPYGSAPGDIDLAF